MKTLCVIPARSGSKGVPGKNIRNVNGKPLMAYAIEAAKKANKLDRIIVSTDSKEFAKVAEEYGAEVPFIRPPEYATDDICITAVAKHAMEFFDSQSIYFDAIISLQITSPLTLSSDIDKCISKMEATDCDSVISMKELEEAHPWRIYDMKNDKIVPFNEHTNENFPQRQDRPPAYKFSGAIYLRKHACLENWNGVDFALGNDRRGILIPSERNVDINNPIDLLVAETLINQGFLSEEDNL